MKVARTFFKAITITSTTLLLGLAGCAFDEPIDYTTGGYGAGPQGGSGADDSSAGGGLAIAGDWPVQFGSSSDDFVRASGTDSEGNVYVGGYTDGSLDGNPDSAGRELFVSKYDSTGQVVWTRQVPGILNPYGFDMTVAANGDVYATGDTQNNFDGYTNVGDLDVFVIKFDKDGNKVWSTSIGSTSMDTSQAIALDGNGYLYVGGSARGNFDGNIRSSQQDLLMIKYDLDGNKIWSLLEGSIDGHGSTIRDLKVDSNGNVVVGGVGTPLTPLSGSRDAFVSKYNSDGVRQWAYQVATSGAEDGGQIAIDFNDNIYFGGVTSGSWDGNNNLGNYDILLIKLDSNGIKKWSKQFGSSDLDSVRTLVTDTDNNIFISGITDGILNGLTSLSGRDSYIKKYDSEGNQIWAKQFGTEGDDDISRLSMDSADNIYIAGHTTGAIDNHTNAGGSDGVIMKMNSDEEFISGGSSSGSGGSISFTGGGATERITAGAHHNCVIKADDSLQCWGRDVYGQISVPSGLGSVKSVAAGHSHNCAIKADDSLQCWGWDYYGHSTVSSGLGSVKSVAAGAGHTCAIKADDSLQCWGDDNYGQSTVPSGLGSVKSVASGYYHTCAIKADDSLQCWGNDNYGQSTVPSGLGSVKSVAGGFDHTCAIKADDSLQCWGNGNYGQSSVPTGLGSVKGVAAAHHHTCAIKADDSLQCWGRDDYGQSSVPTGLGSVKNVAAGGHHTCAIKADDSVQCWGRDDHGQSSVPAELQSGAAGTVEWTRQLGTSAWDVGHGVAVDQDGNLYVAGYTGGSIDSNSNGGDQDVLVVKYNSSGIKQWAQQLGSPSKDRAYGIAIDSDGDIYVAGFTEGSIDGNSSAGSSDLIIAKYNASGVKLWARQKGTSSIDIAYGIATDNSGNLYVTGYTLGSLNGNTSAGGYDIFVVKYDSAGAEQWTQQLGTYSADYARDITVDNNDNIYVAGYTGGGLDGNSSAGFHDLFVVKYSSSGVKQWTQQLGSSSGDVAIGITTDMNGNVYATGYTVGNLDGNSSAGSDDLLLIKYDSEGNRKWTQQLGTAASDYALDVTSDSSGNIYFTGYTGGDLDGNTSAGDHDILLIKYDSSGVRHWSQQMGTSSYEVAHGITSNSSGNVYLTGGTQGAFTGNNAGQFDLFVMKLK